MSETRPAAILIAGPTASGKSGLASVLAERLGGVIINADSMQVYRELRVVTARPSAEDEARVPHRLYGHVPAGEAYSAGRFVTEAASTIAEARAGGLLPVVVGGTGLYFKALLDGLSPIPTIPAEARAFWRREGERLGAERLHGELARRDSVMADRLASTDTQRIVRALEVLEATGRSLAEWQEMPGTPVLAEAETLGIVLAPERDELYRRCNRRFDSMMEAGALEEAGRLREMQLDAALPAMRALGVAPLLRHLAGELSCEAAVELAKTDTRQYAKRQLTWLRRYMISWNWLDTKQMETGLLHLIADIRSVP